MDFYRRLVVSCRREYFRFLVGMVVWSLISLVITPPSVSIPNDSGVTSSNKDVFYAVQWYLLDSCPYRYYFVRVNTFEGAFPKNSCTFCWTAGIRVEPPTRITSSISEAFMLASCRAFRRGSIVAWIRLSHNCSNWARVSVRTRCFGIPLTGNMYGRLISVEVELDNSIFAFSAASFKPLVSHRVFTDVYPSSFWNSSASQLMIFYRRNHPHPKWVVSPLVDFTSEYPSPNSRMEISDITTPEVEYRVFWSWDFLSKPYAKAQLSVHWWYVLQSNLQFLLLLSLPGAVHRWNKPERWWLLQILPDPDNLLPFLHFLQNHGRNFLWGILTIVDHYPGRVLSPLTTS